MRTDIIKENGAFYLNAASVTCPICGGVAGHVTGATYRSARNEGKSYNHEESETLIWFECEHRGKVRIVGHKGTLGIEVEVS